MRITFAGCSTSSVMWRSSSSPSSGGCPEPPDGTCPSGPTTTTCGSPGGLSLLSSRWVMPSTIRGTCAGPSALRREDDLADVVAGLHDPVALAGVLERQRDVHQRLHR